jgi:hypothetical protein
MPHSHINRRTMLKGATAIGALLAASGELFAQQAPTRSAKSPGAPLPPRGEFIIRGATVLTMDPKLGDLATGDVERSSRLRRRSTRKLRPSKVAA